MAGNFFRGKEIVLRILFLKRIFYDIALRLGTSVEQDGRWGKSDEKLMKQMSKSGKFAPILDTKVINVMLFIKVSDTNKIYAGV